MSALLLNHKETLIYEHAFLEGCIEGIRDYAIWRNGEQLVGCLERPLKEVIAPLEQKSAKIKAQLIELGH